MIPGDVRELTGKHALQIFLQPSVVRAFPDEEYRKAGAEIQEDLSGCPVIFGIKEIPLDFLRPGKTYVFFSHTIKGQPHNMPMLLRLLQLRCTLIDYERIVDDRGRRLIGFGRHAGLAGMIDTLWALGKRLDWERMENPFSGIRQALHYGDLEEARAAISSVGQNIEAQGLPEPLVPLVCGFAGYGNVSQGAQEMFDLLPVREISPEELPSVTERSDCSRNIVYKVVFREEHLAEPISVENRFELQDYYRHPGKYRARFDRYLLYLSIFMNCIYWEERYPRLVTKRYLRRLYGGAERPRLRVIGDITCDVEGAVECTLRATDPGNPVFTYDPFTDQAVDGVAGAGPVVLAVDNLPCELPRESSAEFSRALKDFVPPIAQADYSVPFERCDLPPEIKRAVIAYRGELTAEYRYLEKYVR